MIRHIILAISLLAAPAVAQTIQSSISGTVTDSSHKPIAGAPIQVVHEETNRRRSAVTDAAGVFSVSNLAPGQYRVEADKDGFRKHSQQISLQLNQEIHIEIPLLSGQRTETVQVTEQRAT